MMSFNQFKIFTTGLLLLVLIGCDQQSASSATTANNQSQPKVTPQAVEAALASADEYLNRQDYPSAELILRKLIEKAPTESRAYEFYGKLLLTRALLPEAKANPDEKSKLLNQAYEQYAKAAELTQANKNDHELAASLHQSAGEIASMAKRPDDALKHFLQAGSKLQIESGDSNRVASWLAEKTSIAVLLPITSDPACKLLGGRKCTLAGRPAAFAVYDMQGTPVSLVVLDVSVVSFEDMREVSHRGVTHLVGRRTGFTIVASRRDSLVYAAVGKLPEKELLCLVTESSYESH
ncbi:MAG: hypothetical protein IIC51_02215 [Planctomycetes bacterium]|nr:hypothetical protein [Planctomycetota bacterium]